ncbi:hypothetical protein ACFQZS_01290 [Mucilaginibacter calamicampi]|uniref:Uncharacterized protein n=1 Tax=Mucilaginibacter calamicampi TaxID=1302352 RepID=A0ABW2YS12_9SPHI
METSIENIWKEGFLDESSLVVPQINDLYNQKSIHAVDGVKRMYRINQVVIVAMALVFPVVHYFVDALWQGFACSVLLLLTVWYNNSLARNIKTLHQGANSYDYLQSFNNWLKDVELKSKKIARLSYPLYVVIGLSTIWSAWNKQGMTQALQQNYPALNIPIIALTIAVIMVLLMFYFSIKIYKWEVRVMYGRVLEKLEDTIADMEKLKRGAE